jgi:hypothetical protein
MDAGLFFAGVVGALAFLLLVRNNPLPEFRPLFDVVEAETQLKEGKAIVSSTRKAIDGYQERLDKAGTPAEAERLLSLINTSFEKIKLEAARVAQLERHVRVNQAVSRTIGSVIYFVVGGVIGAALAGVVTIQGLPEDAGNIIQAFVIGSAWSAYLGSIGVRIGEQQLDSQLENTSSGVAEQIRQLREEVIPKIVAAAEGRSTQETTAAVETAISNTSRHVQSEITATRQALRTALR